MLKRLTVFTLALLFVIRFCAGAISFGNENLTFSITDEVHAGIVNFDAMEVQEMMYTKGSGGAAGSVSGGT